MANIKNVELETNLFEELSDTDLMAVVGGSGGSNSGVLQSVEDKVLGQNKVFDIQNKVLKTQYNLVKNTTDKLGTDGQ